MWGCHGSSSPPEIRRNSELGTIDRQCDPTPTTSVAAQADPLDSALECADFTTNHPLFDRPLEDDDQPLMNSW